MMSLKLLKIGLISLTTTVGFTTFVTFRTAIAREKIIFVPPILSSPRRLIPAGTRVYEPSSMGDRGINADAEVQSVPNTIPGLDGIFGSSVRRGIPKNRVRQRSPQCLQGKLPLTALIPESQIGLTTVANPTLFFYLPQTSAPELELIVQNENEQEVYTQKYKPSNKAGIIGLRLPVNSLEVNKQYKWKFSVICNSTDKSQNKAVAGLVQRISPDPQLVKKLQQATRQERAFVYAASGIWHDALVNVAQMRYWFANNQEIASDWEGLLTATGVGLSQQIAQEPLISPPEVLQPQKKYKF